MTAEQRLAEIQIAVDEALNYAYDNKAGAEYDHEAINWGDLGCVDVRYYTGIDDKNGFEILIEEAAPDCRRLCYFIHQRLFEEGIFKTGENVEVRTEW